MKLTHRTWIIAFFIASGICSQMPVNADPVETVYHVCDATGDDTKDGLSWATALKTVGAAVDKTIDGDEVIVAPGAYNITVPVVITNGITLHSQSGTYTDTSLYCDRAVVETNVLVLRHADAFVSGFTVSNGVLYHDNDNPWNHMGANIWIDGGGTVSNCFITKGKGAGGPGGVYNNNGHITHSRIEDNSEYSSYRFIGLGLYQQGEQAVTEFTVIANNQVNNHYAVGGGVHMTGGIVANCIITNNRTRVPGSGGGRGGGVYMTGGELRNSLIAGNSGGNSGGGGVYLDGGDVVNCTIVENTATQGGGIFRHNNGNVINCVLWHNTISSDDSPGAPNWSGLSETDTFNCATPVAVGVSPQTDDPQFRDPDAGNWRVYIGSVCIDAGAYRDWMDDAVDLDGNPRISGASVDIGAYEYTPDVLECNFVAEPLSSFLEGEVNLTAYADGPDPASIEYRWSITSYPDDPFEWTDWSGSAVLTRTLQAGLYTVALQVRDALEGSDERLREDYVLVGAENIFLVPADTLDHVPVRPYASWETAATNIHNAVAMAEHGSTVWITNGCYGVADREVLVQYATTLRGVNGPETTSIYRIGPAGSGDEFRVLNMDHPGAVLCGLTVSNGYMYLGYGANVRLIGGLITNCIITAGHGAGGNEGASGAVLDNQNGHVTHSWIVNNQGGWGSFGIGVLMRGADAVVEHSVITNNLGQNYYIFGAGVRMFDGLLQNCVIADNRANLATGNGGFGGGLRLDGGLVHNCLITGNEAGGGVGGGGGVNINGGKLINCTIVDNKAAYGGGIRYNAAAGNVINCIIYHNINDEEEISNWSVRDSAAPFDPEFDYSCTYPLDGIIGEGNINSDPLFLDRAEGDYRLQVKSPSVFTGLVQDWMTNAVALDGNPRLSTLPGGINKVDMGCYQTPPPPPSGTVIFLK